MYVLEVRNVNVALPNGAHLLRRNGVQRPSRYGDVIELDEPVTTHYANPLERVLFSAQRDANPFLHLFESLWILAGRQDVAFLERFAKRMAEFSDDGMRFHAAYGARLRRWGEGTHNEEHGAILDQLTEAVGMLRSDPGSRRVVCSIWDPMLDLAVDSKDLPCNDMIKFEARSGKLNMVVFNRSNDLVWGTYGANAVQFAFILEYVAAMAGLPVGWYEQVSCNYHAYTATLDKAVSPVDPYHDMHDPYCPSYQPVSLVTDPGSFDAELRAFLEWCDRYPSWHLPELQNTFLSEVAAPLFRAYAAHKRGDMDKTTKWLTPGIDWHDAALAWLARRQK